jgi:phosphatidylserine/phosphatidylglycerophosphate/cardiolipin synthase-like enzyme
LAQVGCRDVVFDRDIRYTLARPTPKLPARGGHTYCVGRGGRVTLEAMMILAVVLAFLGPIAVVAWILRRPLRVQRYTIDPYSSDGRYKREVIRVINSARTHITMARGEIPPDVYNEEVAAALRAAHRRGVKITLVCGPEVRMPDEGPHPVLQLADEGVLDLYYPHQTRPVHFIEADSRTLYLEAPHPHGAREREVTMFEDSFFRAKDERRRLLADIEAGTIVRVKSAFERHVLLTDGERERLEDLSRAKGKDFEALSAEEIEHLRHELN